MFGNKRGVPADQFAQAYARSINLFVKTLSTHVVSLSLEEASSPRPRRHEELCAMAWAWTIAAFESSKLEKKDKDRLLPLVFKNLQPAWQRYFASQSKMSELLSRRAAEYLIDRDFNLTMTPNGLIETARVLLEGLLRSIGASHFVSVKFMAVFTMPIAEGLMTDINLINDVKTTHGILY